MGVLLMFSYEKGFCNIVLGAVVLLAWVLLKAVFYRLPLAVYRLITKKR